MILQVLFLQCFLCVSVSGFSCYISPVAVVNESCTVSDNTTLRPCYTLQQLSSQNNWLLTITQLTLILLPGTHRINQTSVFNASELEIYSWNQLNKSMIYCEHEWLVFEARSKLNISSLHFNSCPIQCAQATLIINGSVFTESKQTYALMITQVNPLYASSNITSSIFSSNNGGILYDRASTAATYGVLKIADTLFVANRILDSGGALRIRYVNMHLTIRRCSFINNSANSGGAIYYTGIIHAITETIFRSNTARDKGGAINVKTISIDKCQFENNCAKNIGGAIYSDGVTMSNSTFHNNSCSSVGGAIAVWKIDSYNCQFTENKAIYYGGAAVIYGKGFAANLNFKNTTFWNNSAVTGGALYFEDAAKKYYPPPSIISCNFHDNLAHASGGAIHFNNFSSCLNFKNSSFSSNKAVVSGGALFISHSKICVESIVFTNNIVTSAQGKGGAIYAEDEGSCNVSECFLAPSTNNEDNQILQLVNNSATHGPVLYGGLMDRCTQSAKTTQHY